LGRDFRARQQKIERRRRERGERRPFLDCVTALENKEQFAILLPNCYPTL
jgi:hypothetical protein